MTPKRHSEINLPLTAAQACSSINRVKVTIVTMLYDF